MPFRLLDPENRRIRRRRRILVNFYSHNFGVDGRYVHERHCMYRTSLSGAAFSFISTDYPELPFLVVSQKIFNDNTSVQPDNCSTFNDVENLEHGLFLRVNWAGAELADFFEHLGMS